MECSDVVEGESTRLGDCSNVGREGELVMVTRRFLAEDEGVTVADPRVIERSWEKEGLAGMCLNKKLPKDISN